MVIQQERFACLTSWTKSLVLPELLNGGIGVLIARVVPCKPVYIKKVLLVVVLHAVNP